MGKKRIITESGQAEIKTGNTGAAVAGKRKLVAGVVHIQATYNNTKITLANAEGGAILASSSGALGFKGAKKGTPFAAGKVAEVVAERGQALGLKEIDVILRGVGSGREAAVRAFAGKGLVINTLKDVTPVPFNGPKPPKPRRV
ncbi:MAG: 30S ribosomal protein S11 [Patescibacteria group bacterium]|nr:30S ribosomal protein S11 [Patescibacteria group bacterium]